MRWILFIAAMILASWTAAPARAEWREATSPHFIVISDGSERELIRMTQRLEAFHWLMGVTSRAPEAENIQRVRIYMVNNISEIQRAAGEGRNSTIAGFYRPSISGAYAMAPRMGGQYATTILFHEYAHHFMLQYVPFTMPPWLTEGLAEVFSHLRLNEMALLALVKWPSTAPLN